MIGPKSASANIAWATAAKLLSIVCAVFSVPLLLALLGTEQYGMWATLTSLVAFISLLDLGVGNSMRNSVASMSTFNAESVRLEFIGFFRLLCLVGLVTTLGFCVALLWLDVAAGHVLAAWVLYVPLLVLLPLMLGSSVLQGARATGLQSVLHAVGGFGYFTYVGFLAWLGRTPTINELAVAWTSFYLIALVAVFLLGLRTLQLPARRLLSGSFASLPSGRLRVGLEFLVLQLSSLVLYSLGNLLVFQHLGSSEVARFDVLNKIFQVGLSIYTIVIGVMWSEIAKSRAACDADGLARTLRRLAGIAVLFSVACLLGAMVVPALIDLWTHHRIVVETHEALAIAGLVSVQSMAYVGAVFMNAFERIRLQIFLAVVATLLMVPLTSLLMAQGLGIASVPIAATLLTFVPMIVCSICAVQLIRGVGKIEGSPA